MLMVQFDKTFLSGALEGLTVPGQVISYPNAARASAERTLQHYRKVEVTGDFMRDAVTGDKFKVSNVGLYMLSTKPRRY